MTAHFTFRSTIRSVSVLLIIASAATAQQSIRNDKPGVQPAALATATLGKTGESVQFGRRAARVGDEVEQTLSLEMRLKTAIRKGNDLQEQKQTAVRTQQQRVVTATEVEQDRTMAVTVQYLRATRASGDTPAPAVANEAGQPQVVQGKTYHCRREPGKEGRLTVTDEAGHIPTLEEYEIVVQGMDHVGRANSLAEFLAGRTIAVGQTLTLPNELATRIFNLGDAFGEVAKFELTLREVRNVNDVRCAVFIAKISAASHGGSQMRMEIEGPFAVEVATCRAAEVNLSGPLSMTETRGTYSTAYHMLATGRLAMSAASNYRDAKR